MRTNLIVLLLLSLLISPASAETRVHLVSLLSSPVKVAVNGVSHALATGEKTDFSVQSSVLDLAVVRDGKSLYRKRLGITDKARYTLVVFGSPDAPQPHDTWTMLKRQFEGEGAAHRLGYAVQIAVLRDEAYIEEDKSYLRLFHGATGLVPVQLMENREPKTRATYAQTSELLPLEPGNHHFTIEAEDGHLPVVDLDLSLRTGELTTIFLAERSGLGPPYAVTSNLELR